MTLKDIKKMNLDILVAKYQKALFSLKYVEHQMNSYIKHNLNDIDTNNFIQILNTQVDESFASYMSNRHRKL